MTQPADAMRRYVADFQTFTGNGAAGAPPWLKQIREAAITRFSELGFPSTRQEDWRFTSVAPIAETTFALSHAAHGSAAPTELDWVTGADAHTARLVFVDGAYAPTLSMGAPRGVRVSTIAAALATDGDLVREHLARHASFAASPFAALNTAFLADGAFVRVPAGVEVEQPIEIVFATRGGHDPAVAHPRCLIVVERGARATIVESYLGLGDGRYWTNAVTEVVLDSGAQLEHFRVQRESRDGYHVATTQTEQHRDSTLRLHPLTLGAGLARHDTSTTLNGPGAELVLNGFYLLRGSQHGDHHTVIDHAQPHGTSHEFFNGILGERAHGVFTGRIIVRPGAQRTDSKQTNNNLLLSAEARADSQPQLEIYADDVKCTHGSTAGPLDEMAMFYLRSRGLSPDTAAGLLTYGFAAEILGRMSHAGVRARLDGLVRARLADRSRGGRRA
jgi:Fe-S cluster assembly protein SufD